MKSRTFTGPRSVDPRMVIVATCLTTACVWIATSAVPAIIPDIGRGLGASQSDLQWIGDIFPLVLASLLLPAGAALDRWGRRKGMILGLCAMSAGLIWSAWAGSATALILARGLSGVGAGFVFPATLATITSALPDERRSRAIAYWTISVLAGAIVGIFGAALLQPLAWWGAIFVMSGALTVVALLLVAYAVPETADAERASRDPLGVMLSLLAIGGLVFAVTEGPTRGWTSTTTLGPLIVGALSLLAFVAWELHTGRPLLDLRVFRDGRVAAASLSLFVIFAADFGMLYLLFQYFQLARGYDAIGVALLMAPSIFVFAPMALVGPAIADRRGLAPSLLGACSVCAGGLTVMALATPTVVGIVVGMMIFWGGLGAAMTPATRAITDALPAAQQGIASALNDVARELGTAVGIAVLGSMFKMAYRHDVVGILDRLPDGTKSAVKISPAVGIQVLADLGSAGLPGVGLVQDGVTTGWRLALLVGAAGVVGSGICIYRLGRRLPSACVSQADLDEPLTAAARTQDFHASRRPEADAAPAVFGQDVGDR